MLTSRQEMACIWAITMGGQDNIVEVVTNLQEGEGVNVSGWIVRRALKRAELSSKLK